MTVKMNLRPLTRFVDKIEARHGPLNDVYLTWGSRYRAFAKLRYMKFARGGGNWAPLSEVTKRRRRKAAKGKKGPRSFSILIDKGTLVAALEPKIENPGSIKKLIGKGVRVGYGGSAKHPRAKGLTIARLAEIHHRGLGNVPARPIIVRPDTKTLRGMVSDLERGIKKMETWVR